MEIPGKSILPGISIILKKRRYRKFHFAKVPRFQTIGLLNVTILFSFIINDLISPKLIKISEIKTLKFHILIVVCVTFQVFGSLF